MYSFFNKPVGIFFGVFIIIMAAAYFFNNINAPQRLPQRVYEIAPDSSGFMTITDKNGSILMQTGLPIYVEDEFINEDNIHYKVINITGEKATAEIKSEQNYQQTSPQTHSALSAISASGTYLFRIPEKPKNVVIYHTHTDESYVPTSGTASELKGGDIIKVGAALKQALNKVNFAAVHNTETHTPHDINAYHRSRKTLVKLLKKGPDAVFDIHRDATPASTYHTTINGVDTAKVMIVVGRSNPLMKTNLGYAKRIKAVCDNTHPGLIRGIFIGKGDYNQDLYPSALLFEIGSHNNSLIMAERGARSLADAIITAFAETE